jgi:hypothetical protein
MTNSDAVAPAPMSDDTAVCCAARERFVRKSASSPTCDLLSSTAMTVAETSKA